MKTRTLKELLLYNYRYWFGYSIVIGFIIYFLGWRIGSLPGGISQAEIAVAARHLSFQDILHLPLYPLHAALQWVSMTLFDISAWSLRLPSIIIGLLVALILYNLLKRWFGKSTALLSTAIFISADWFLFIARLGTGAVEFSLWLSLAIVSLTKLLEHKSKWLLLYITGLAGLLFAPFGIYAVLVLLISLFTCRVFRERAAEAKLWVKLLSGVIFVAGLAALSYASFKNIAFLKNLVGIESLPTVMEYGKNVLNNLGGVVAVLPNSNPLISPSGIFFVRFFELIFILFGVIMFWRTRVNRLNLVMLVLSTVLALASGLSAGSRGSGLILVPAAIFMTAGIRHLLHRWQRTFPLNPYARITAYVPLAIVFICVVALHYVSYFELWQSQPAPRSTFSRDYALLKTELNQNEYRGKTCYVDSTEEDFNKLLLASQPNCQLKFPEVDAITDSDYIIARQNSPIMAGQVVRELKVLTSETTNNNVRWLIDSNQPAN